MGSLEGNLKIIIVGGGIAGLASVCSDTPASVAYG